MATLSSGQEHPGQPFGSLVSTRLVAPRLADDSLRRAALLARACPDPFQGGRLCLVVAPAGYGKSTLLAQCQRQLQVQGVVTAWLTLEPDDNDEFQFFYYLGAAFSQLHDDITGALVERHLGERHAFNSRRLLSELLALVATAGDCALLLDDFHCIENPEIHQALQYLLKYLPANLTIYLGARSLPPIPLAKLKAADQLLQLDSLDLAFSEVETQTLLMEANKLCLEPADVALLRERTGGWAAVLQLAALSLRNAGDQRQWIADFHADQGSVADFLAEEVLNQLPSAQAGFLARIAIAERFSGPLCLAITGDERNSEHLAALRDSRLLVQSLDERGYWYRLHPLFRDFLLESYLPRLLTGDAERAQLHARASRWFEDEGLVGEAIQHAISAGDEDRALELLDEQGLTLLASGQFSLLFTLFRRLPAGLLQKSQTVLMQLAWLQLLNNQLPEGRRLVAELKQQMAGQTEEKLIEIYTMEANIHCLDDQLEAMAQLIDKWAARAPEEPVYLRGAWRNFQAVGLYNQQRFDEALAVTQASLAIPTVPDLVFAQSYSACLCALVQAAMGRLREGGACLENFQAAILKYLGSHSQAGSLIDPLLGALCYYQGDLARAEALYQRGWDAQRTIASVDLVMQVVRTRSRLLFNQRRYEEATTYLAESLALASSRGWQRLLACVTQEQVRLYIALGEQAQAQTMLDAWQQRNHGKAMQVGQQLQDECLQLAALRLGLANGEQVKVAVELKTLLATAIADGRTLTAIELCVLLAKTYIVAGKPDQARQALIQALSLDEGHCVIQSFRDEGEEVIVALAALKKSLAQSPATQRHLLWQSQLEQVLTPYVEVDVGLGADRAAPPDFATGLAGELTKKELATLALLVEGLSNKEIADRMCVSTNTVKTHLQSAYGKLGVSRRTQAVRCLKRLGIFE